MSSQRQNLVGNRDRSWRLAISKKRNQEVKVENSKGTDERKKVEEFGYETLKNPKSITQSSYHRNKTKQDSSNPTN